jgi:hypothetical protein
MTPPLPRQEIEEKLKQVFTIAQAASLMETLEITWRHEAKLAKAQNRTDEGLAKLEKIVEQLAEAQVQAEKRWARFEEAQVGTAERLARLEEFQIRAEERFDRIDERFEQVDKRFDQMDKRMQRMEGRLGNVEGWQLEHNYREKAYSYFGRVLRNVKVVPLQDLEEQLQAHLSPKELYDLIPLDLLVRGRPRNQTDVLDVWLAIEVSTTIDRSDVERAQRRAALLRQAHFPAIPTVAGEEITAGAQELLEEDGGVLLIQDGHIEFWEDALTAVSPA